MQITLTGLQSVVKGWAVGLRLVAMAANSLDELDSVGRTLQHGVQPLQEYLNPAGACHSVGRAAGLHI